MLNHVIYSSALWLILLGTSALALKISLEKCPRNMTAVGNLKFEDYSGTWYLQMMYPNLAGSPSLCRYSVLTESKNGRKAVLSGEIRLKTQTLSKRTVLVNEFNGKAGNYEMEKGLKIYVLETDYRSYTIEYSCFEVEGYMSVEWAAIKTRTRVPSASTMRTARELATSHGIKVDQMISIKQLSCPVEKR